MTDFESLPEELSNKTYNIKWALELKKGLEKAHAHRVHFRKLYAEALTGNTTKDPSSIYEDPLYYELLVINNRANFHMKDCMGMKDNRGCFSVRDAENYNDYLDAYTQTFPDSVEDMMSLATNGNLHLLKR